MPIHSRKTPTLTKTGNSRLALMGTDGYKTAGDLMVKAAGHDKLARDTLVFPIIFNYRHSAGDPPAWRSPSNTCWHANLRA